MPKVSAIIPTYNSVKYIVEAIDSVLVQICKDFEIVIVDDGSTDATKIAAAKYTQEYPDKIKYFYQQNQGPGAARNRGLQEARGEYVAFLDADDALTENSLEKRIQFLERHKEADLVFTDYNIDVGKKQTINARLKNEEFLPYFKDAIATQEKNEIVFNAKFYKHYFSYSPLPIWTGTVMMRKRVVDKVGLFRTDISVGEDADYWLRIAKQCKVGYIDEPLAIYQYSNSTLTKQTEKYSLDTIKLYGELYTNNKEPLIKRAARKRLADSYYWIGNYYRTTGKTREARKCFAKSIGYNLFNFSPYKGLISTFYAGKT